MANITRIKAQDPHAKREKPKGSSGGAAKSSGGSVKAAVKKQPGAKSVVQSKKTARSKKAVAKAGANAKTVAKVDANAETATATKTTAKSVKSITKTKTPKTKTAKTKSKKPRKVPAIFKPFAAFGRYVKASWGELSAVRWPSRKYTWKMTAAMLVYCVFFLVIIVLLDLLFTFIFNELLK